MSTIAPTLSLTESQTFEAMRIFLLTLVPNTVEVVRGLTNRVAEPQGADFIVMTPLLHKRLRTNVDTYSDTESITFTTFTNTPSINDILVNGTATAQGTVIGIAGTTVTLEPGTGSYFSVGDIITDQTTSLPVGTVTAASYGNKAVAQGVMVGLQVDIHGPNSADTMQILNTLFRDQYAVDVFATTGYDVTPLYADDPIQTTFLNGEQQIEERWTIDAILQCNPVVTVPAQFMSAVEVTTISVEATYPVE